MSEPGPYPTKSVLKDNEELQEYILLTLGAPQIKVELVQEDLDEAIEEARRWWTAKKGFPRRYQFSVSSGRTEYPLPDDADRVIDVYVPSRPTDFSRIIDPLGLLDASIPYSLFPHPQAGGLFSTYAQALQYLEEAKRITGGEIEWYQQDRTLFLFPVPKYAGRAEMLYKSNHFSLQQLPERDHSLIKHYAVACAKRKLGYVRRLYSGFPSAQGSTQLDGQQMYQEAVDAIQALDEEISQSGFPMGWITG